MSGVLVPPPAAHLTRVPATQHTPTPMQGRDSLFDNVTSCGVDPRSIAQRIMDIRTQ
jgi:hypothetical protein